jgi:putative peptidoglycan lipid II flippase
MLGAALGTILLPSLSKTTPAPTDEYSNLLDWGLRLTLLLAAAGGAGARPARRAADRTLFHHGAFQADDVFQTRRRWSPTASA